MTAPPQKEEKEVARDARWWREYCDEQIRLACLWVIDSEHCIQVADWRWLYDRDAADLESLADGNPLMPSKTELP